MGVPGGGLPRAWAAALCLSLAAGDLPTLATTPELPFQKFPVLPPQCRNNIYAEPVDPADVVPGGHRRLCGPARGTSWNGKVDLTVLGGAFVGPNAKTLQLVRKRVIQVRFNMSVPRARVPEKASTRRERSEG